MRKPHPTTVAIPSSPQHWLEMFESVFLTQPYRQADVNFHDLPIKKLTRQNAHDFIEASFRFKDTRITNHMPLSGWADLMKQCLGLTPSNVVLGVEVSKCMLRISRMSYIYERDKWPSRAEEWIKHFISVKNHAVVQLLWNAHHFDGRGVELASHAMYEDVAMLEIFLDRVDPRVNKFELLKNAIRMHSLPMFDRLLLPSKIKNKGEVLLYALNHRPVKNRRARPFRGTDAEKALFEEKQRANQKVLEIMIDRLVPLSDLNHVFFSQKISEDTQWLIPHLSKKSMQRLKKEPYHDQVKDLPQYQSRLLNESIGATAHTTRVRKL